LHKTRSSDRRRSAGVPPTAFGRLSRHVPPRPVRFPHRIASPFNVTSFGVTSDRGIFFTMPTEQNLAERGMAVGLRALNRLASSGLVDRLGIREPTERFLHGASKTTMRTATRAGRTFAAAQKLTTP